MVDSKELHDFAVGGNANQLQKGCSLTLFNEDVNGAETDTVVINLGPTQLEGLIMMLQQFVQYKGGE